MYSSNIFRLLFFVFLLITIFAAWAETRLYSAGSQHDQTLEHNIFITPQIKLISVDGKKFRNNLLDTGNTTLYLPTGNHELLVRYDWIWDLDSDNFDPVQSDPVLISFDVENGKTYNITQRKFETYSAAKVFSQSPEFIVSDQVASTVVAPGMPANASVPKAESASSGSRDTGTSPVPKSRIGADYSDSSVRQNPGPSALMMLQFWWQRSSPEEKKEFRQWLDGRVQ